jgi:cyclic beta-1,2-glucan synthetase
MLDPRLVSGRSRTVSQDEATEPIRAELFSVERLEQHAESLAAAQAIAPNSRHDAC